MWAHKIFGIIKGSSNHSITQSTVWKNTYLRDSECPERCIYLEYFFWKELGANISFALQFFGAIGNRVYLILIQSIYQSFSQSQADSKLMDWRNYKPCEMLDRMSLLLKAIAHPLGFQYWCGHSRRDHRWIGPYWGFVFLELSLLS